VGIRFCKRVCKNARSHDGFLLSSPFGILAGNVICEHAGPRQRRITRLIDLLLIHLTIGGRIRSRSVRIDETKTVRPINKD